ncbi:MAG: hypothetical protein GKR94_01935 [Gammaproteobacteria bacterium]|nr:hypothetical protein [Gammaproteobacteria bacterium]
MTFDTLIKNGTIVDGSAAPGYRDGGANTVDAEEHSVTPGFVHIHTHPDAQITRDPTASPSCWHGMTPVVG